MKKLLLMLSLLMILVITSFPQNYDNAGMDYSKAIFDNKTPSARITALKAYINKYTDTTNKFVRLAYYQLSLNYFESKKYKSAIQTGEKTLNLGSIGTGEESRLSLVLANSYGIKSYAGFNKEKALKYTNKAISLGQKAGDNKVVSTAKKLKKSLSGPPPRKLTPEQKIKMHYGDDEFRKAISYYNTLGASDKNNSEIARIYAYSLFKARRYDSALKQFTLLYSKESKGVFPKYIGDIYTIKSKKNSKYYDLSASYYLEASLLYKKEKSSSNQKIAAGKARVQLENKYNYKAKYRKYQSDSKKLKASSQKNEKAIRDAKREVRKFKRYLRNTYSDIQAPQFETDKLRKLEAKAARIESGGNSSSGGDAGGEALLKLREKIDKEYKNLLAKAKEKLEL
ncbi:MAG: hypothetical protein ABFR75_03175 [Acidobacteriota bacterium]